MMLRMRMWIPSFPECLLLFGSYWLTGEWMWMYQRHGFRDNIVFWAPTCQPQASVCLHRPNPIAVRSFKPRAWESLWKEHWGPLLWKGHCLGRWSWLHWTERGGSILGEEVRGGLRGVGEGRGTWVQRYAHHCPRVSKWADWKPDKRSAVVRFCLALSVPINMQAGRHAYGITYIQYTGVNVPFLTNTNPIYPVWFRL